MKRLIIILALLAALVGLGAARADVCIDDLDHCYPGSPVSPIPAAGGYQVFLPVVAK